MNAIRSQYMLNLFFFAVAFMYLFADFYFSPLRCYRIDFTFISISVIELIFKEEKIIHETETQKGWKLFYIFF